MQLKGKRVIVTGCARGIGGSAVRAFAAEGAQVASMDILDELGEKEAAAANKLGKGTVRYYHCDVSSRSEVQATFKSALSDLGGLDALLNVAGIHLVGLAETLTDKDWDKIFDVNVKGTLYTNQAAFPYLREKGGRIINFASVAGVNGERNAGHYAASKGAVLAWTRTIAQEWGMYGIRANAIAPAMWTPMFDELRATMSAEQLAMYDAGMAAVIPIGGKLGDPDRDLAPVLVFLVSDGAGFITGQTISVDGGLLMVR